MGALNPTQREITGVHLLYIQKMKVYPLNGRIVSEVCKGNSKLNGVIPDLIKNTATAQQFESNITHYLLFNLFYFNLGGLGVDFTL